MICVIRIHGRVGVDRKVKETLERLRLGKKYTCVVIANPNKEQVGMIKKVRDFVASGDIKKDVFEKLIDKRGRKIDKKKSIDSKKVVEELEKGKIYESLNLKPFFRLHPPRGGINSKLHFPKGVLGDNKEKINDLVLRML
uniref:50S ribosomal protein L30, large subunit ribosomal protein L30 n=1 Tax=uncultured archaeon Rifle_16ft_4_minimus_37913 TaxID=1665152 RepID=A0A0H4T915_9ARCH|nr:50S ribosomal protein L30, large subunit ribosomal protein L30 [uncultured archaeon Rifle_16ft_4_minimus_37913]